MDNDGINSSHAISSPREHIDDKFFIGSPPRSHFEVGPDLELDIFNDVLNLTILAMQGNRTESQSTEDRDNVCLRSANRSADSKRVN